VPHIPPINQPLEGVAHAKWLQDRSIKDRADIDALLAWKQKMGRDSATNARQVTAINNLSRGNSGTTGVPPGGFDGDRFGKLSDLDYDFDWVRNTLGGAELSYFNLPEEGDYVNIQDVYESKFFEVNIDSPADDTPFSVRFPESLHVPLDIGTAFYIFSLYVYGNTAEVTFLSDVPFYYDHPGVNILGTPVVSGAGTITLPAGFVGQWFVMCNPSQGPSLAIPLQDDYYGSRFGPSLSTSATTPTVVATAAAGTSPTVTVNGTSTSGVVELATGTSPTTTGWGELLTFTGGWASGDVPVLALYPANQAAAALTHYGTRAGTEAEAHFDLTGIAASTTYKFHYSLLPYTAV